MNQCINSMKYQEPLQAEKYNEYEERAAIQFYDDGLLNEQYLQNNIALYPCNQEAKPLVKKYNKNHELIKENQIRTIEQLQRWKQKGILVFSFFPADHNLLILDLDNSDAHANKTNGVENFIEFIKPLNLNEPLKSYFTDFPHNFPCYVITPHNGIHLYFKASYVTDAIKQCLNTSVMNARNIEIKYKTQVTAGGSLRNGKEYFLRGRIKDAPCITLTLLDAMMRPTQNVRQETPKRNGSNPYNGRRSNTKNYQQWNETPEGVIAKAQELYSCETPHHFVLKTAVLFQKAGFTKSEAETYITQTPQHLRRRNKADTISTINSVFK